MLKVVAGFALAFCSLVTSGYASAQPGIPDFDVERHCQKQASFMGGGSFWMKACLEQEQEAYDELKQKWASIDSNTVRLCRRQMSIMGQSYFWLNACIQQELESATALKNFTFRK